MNNTMILKLEQKDDSIYFLYDSEEKFYEICLDIVIDRLEGANYYEGKDEDKAKDIADALDGIAAWKFLKSRSNAEYEGISIITPEN